MTRKAILLVLFLIVGSGCIGFEKQVWSLSVTGHVEQTSDGNVLDLNVELGGNTGGVKISDVRIIVVDSADSVIAERTIPNMDGYTLEEITIEIPNSTTVQYVLVSVGNIQSPKSSECGIDGLERRSGELYPIRQSMILYNISTPTASCLSE